MTLREANYIEQRATIEKSVNEAASALPIIGAMRSGSTPDDAGAAGYFVADEDDNVSYQTWFRVGDAVGTGRIRPR